MEDALDSLERGLEQRDDGLLAAAADPRLRPLHGHRRFQIILEKLRSYSSAQRSQTAGLQRYAILQNVLLQH